MSQANETDGEPTTDVDEEAGVGPDDACRMAMDAALEKGMDYCNTQESRVEALGKMVGLTGDDIDIDSSEALAAGVGDGHDIQTRQWVVARAEKEIRTAGADPTDALNTAWMEAGDRLAAPDEETDAEQGPDIETDDDSDADGDE